MNRKFDGKARYVPLRDIVQVIAQTHFLSNAKGYTDNEEIISRESCNTLIVNNPIKKEIRSDYQQVATICKKNDILFCNAKPFRASLSNVEDFAVMPPVIVIRLRPEYIDRALIIAAYLNTRRAKHYFEVRAIGSCITKVTHKELLNMEVPIHEEPEKVIKLIEDITELKKLQEEQRKLMDQLIEVMVIGKKIDTVAASEDSSERK